MPPFTVQYLCPSQSPLWQGHGQTTDYEAAVLLAQIIKPRLGHVRVVDALGRIVYEF